MHALDGVCFEKPFRFSRSAMRRFAQAPMARVVIAEEDAALVGFAILDIEDTDTGRVGYVVTLDVDPACRRRGVAGALMREVERQAVAEGCPGMLLHVFIGNAAAMQFYEAEGYVRSHRVEGFYGAGMDAWVCRKLLVVDEDR